MPKSRLIQKASAVIDEIKKTCMDYQKHAEFERLRLINEGILNQIDKEIAGIKKTEMDKKEKESQIETLEENRRDLRIKMKENDKEIHKLIKEAEKIKKVDSKLANLNTIYDEQYKKMIDDYAFACGNVDENRKNAISAFEQKFKNVLRRNDIILIDDKCNKIGEMNRTLINIESGTLSGGIGVDPSFDLFKAKVEYFSESLNTHRDNMTSKFLDKIAKLLKITPAGKKLISKLHGYFSQHHNIIDKAQKDSEKVLEGKREPITKELEKEKTFKLPRKYK